MMLLLHVSPGLRVNELAQSLFRPMTAALLAGAVVGMLAPAPMRAANQFANGVVSPELGETTTEFTFTVDYAGNQNPGTVRALLDGGNAILLQLHSGIAQSGTYRAITTLPVGTWTVTFDASAPSVKSISGPTLTVTTAGGSQTPAPTPSPTPTANPTATPGPTATAAPTATSRPSGAPTPTAGATASPPPNGTPAPPTPAGGVLGGGSSPAPTPDDGAPAGSSRATPSPSGGVAAGGSSQRAGASPATAPNEPGDGPDSAVSEGGGVPPAAIMLFVGGAISISGAATLGILTLRARSRHPRTEDGAGT